MNTDNAQNKAPAELAIANSVKPGRFVYRFDYCASRPFKISLYKNMVTGLHNFYKHKNKFDDYDNFIEEFNYCGDFQVNRVGVDDKYNDIKMSWKSAVCAAFYKINEYQKHIRAAVTVLSDEIKNYDETAWVNQKCQYFGTSDKCAYAVGMRNIKSTVKVLEKVISSDIMDFCSRYRVNRKMFSRTRTPRIGDVVYSPADLVNVYHKRILMYYKVTVTGMELDDNGQIKYMFDNDSNKCHSDFSLIYTSEKDMFDDIRDYIAAYVDALNHTITLLEELKESIKTLPEPNDISCVTLTVKDHENDDIKNLIEPIKMMSLF